MAVNLDFFAIRDDVKQRIADTQSATECEALLHIAKGMEEAAVVLVNLAATRVEQLQRRETVEYPAAWKPFVVRAEERTGR